MTTPPDSERPDGDDPRPAATPYGGPPSAATYGYGGSTTTTSGPGSAGSPGSAQEEREGGGAPGGSPAPAAAPPATGSGSTPAAPPATGSGSTPAASPATSPAAPATGPASPASATGTAPGAPAGPAPGTAPATGTGAGGTASGFGSSSVAGSLNTDPPPARLAQPRPSPVTAQPLRSGKPRRAKLVVRRVDPWSVLKFSLLFSICLLIVFVVAVAALYYALDSLGVFDSVNQFVRDITQASGPEGRPTGGFDVTVSPGRVIGGAAVIGAINVVIITAISTLGAFLYNLCSDIVGGIEVTLAERD